MRGNIVGGDCPEAQELLEDLICDARKVALSTNPNTHLARFDRGVFERCNRLHHVNYVLRVPFREVRTLLPGIPPLDQATSQEQALRMNVLMEAGKADGKPFIIAFDLDLPRFRVPFDSHKR